MGDLRDLRAQALRIRDLYRAANVRDGHESWGARDYALGLVGDVGDLAKLVTAKEGLREIPDVDAKLRHELADCLWALLVLADTYDVDLELAFTNAMGQLEQHLSKSTAR